MSKVLVISTSLRAKSNSDILTEQLIAGAKDARHEVEHMIAGSLFYGGISDPGEADGKDTNKDEAYQFGKALA